MSDFRFFKLKSALLVALCAGASMSAMSAFAADPFNTAQKEEVQQIIKDYLMEHPEVVTDALEAQQEKLAKEAEEKARQSIMDNMASLTATDLPSVGSADAPVTIVEFFDYNCGYCKRALPDIQEIVKENDQARFVFIDMPILGPTSATAAQYALAAHNQGKYFEYHAALMEDRSPKDADSLAKIGKDLGLDVEKLKQDADSQEIRATLSENMRMASQIGIHGTPAFIVNGKLFRGYIGKDGLDTEIRQAAEEKGG